MTEFTRVRCDVPRPHVARIVIASGAENALDADLCAELFAAIHFVATTPEMRVVVLSHDGPYFCSGGEVPSVETPEGPLGPLTEVLKGLSQIGKPSIAAIDGKVQGSGLALVLGCDLAFASQDSTIMVPEARVGLWSFHLLLDLVQIVGRRRATEILLRGATISGPQAQLMGLINEVTPGKAADESLAVASTLAGYSPTAMAMGLFALRRAANPEYGAALDWMQEQVDQFLQAPDTREALAAFQAGRDPAWKT